MPSLQRRLDVGLLVSLILFFVFQWAIVSHFVRSITEGHAISRLKQDSEGLLIALVQPSAGAPTLNSERIDPMYKQVFSGRYFQIQIDETVLRSRSLWDQALSFPPVEVGQTEESRVIGPRGQKLLMKVSAYQKKSQFILIAVAEDFSEIEAGILSFQWRYALLSCGILIVLIFIQRKIVHGSFQPLEKGRQEVSALERGEIKQLSEAVPNEIKPFVKEINRLLEGMAQRLQRSRNATGNLAHALKGPLTLLIQLSDHDTLKPFPEVRNELSQQLSLLRRLLDRELKRARLAGSAQSSPSLHLEEEIVSLFDALKKIYHEKALEMTYKLPKGLCIAIDREDFLELLGNLLDNACKWANHRVHLSVEQAEYLRLRIEDDGPGAPPENLAKLSERGTRLDESIEGHGLGLAIAQDIVAQYSGEINFGKSESLGGFQVNVGLFLKQKTA